MSLLADIHPAVYLNGYILWFPKLTITVILVLLIKHFPSITQKLTYMIIACIIIPTHTILDNYIFRKVLAWTVPNVESQWRMVIYSVAM